MYLRRSVGGCTLDLPREGAYLDGKRRCEEVRQASLDFACTTKFLPSPYSEQESTLSLNQNIFRLKAPRDRSYGHVEQGSSGGGAGGSFRDAGSSSAITGVEIDARTATKHQPLPLHCTCHSFRTPSSSAFRRRRYPRLRHLRYHPCGGYELTIRLSRMMAVR